VPGRAVMVKSRKPGWHFLATRPGRQQGHFAQKAPGPACFQGQAYR
jgi:hypothetical protein